MKYKLVCTKYKKGYKPYLSQMSTHLYATLNEIHLEFKDWTKPQMSDADRTVVQLLNVETGLNNGLILVEGVLTPIHGKMHITSIYYSPTFYQYANQEIDLFSKTIKFMEDNNNGEI